MAITEPVTLAEAKAQCRVEFDTDDELISGYITAARQYVENFLNKPLVWEDTKPPEEIPDVPSEEIPDTHSDPVADDPTNEPSEDIPSTPSEDESDDTPEPIVVKQTWKQAILLLVADWYAHRENTIIGASLAVLPVGVHALLWPDRNVPV